MRVMELRRRKGGRHRQNSGSRCTSGRDPCRRVLDDDALGWREAQPLRGEKVAIGGWLSPLHILGGDENGRRKETHRAKPERREETASRRHDGSAFRRNRLKECRGTRQYGESPGVRHFGRFEPADFGFCIEMGSNVAHGLEAASSVRTTNEIGNVEFVPRGPSIPRSHDDRLGIDENAVQIEQDCATAQDSLRQRNLGDRCFVYADSLSMESCSRVW